jgi:MIP family channel proteins
MDQGLRSYWAEFVGTFALCFIGQGAVCVAALSGIEGGSALLIIAIAHGLALATMISALGAASGGHFNPAVTFGFLVTGKQSVPSAIAYWVSQLLGAIVASFLLRGIIPASVVVTTHLGAALAANGLGALTVITIEAILTFFLVTAVWGTAVDERGPKLGGFAIGLTVTMGILFGGPLTGAALNPARATGAALASGTMGGLYLYWVGPMLGGAIAALTYKNLILGKK